MKVENNNISKIHIKQKKISKKLWFNVYEKLTAMVEHNKYDTLSEPNIISNLIYNITLSEQQQEFVNGEMYFILIIFNIRIGFKKFKYNSFCFNFFLYSKAATKLAHQIQEHLLKI